MMASMAFSTLFALITADPPVCVKLELELALTADTCANVVAHSSEKGETSRLVDMNDRCSGSDARRIAQKSITDDDERGAQCETVEMRVQKIGEQPKALCRPSSLKLSPRGDVLAVGQANGQVLLVRSPCQHQSSIMVGERSEVIVSVL